MKKRLLFILFSLFLSFGFLVNAKAQSHMQADQCPAFGNGKPLAFQTKALWDVQFDYNLTMATSGDVGMAAGHFFNNEYWVSRWASDTLYRFNSSGSLVSEFTIAGLTGVRSITSDGTYLYAGVNTGIIYQINPATATLTGSNITTTGTVTSVRFCTYDASLNGGGGGFWVGNFTTAIEAIDMSGNVLSTIAAATHGLTGMYGAGHDNLSPGGPYLWIFDQSGTNTTQLIQLQLPGGTPTGLTHDVFTDISAPNSLTSALAGGAFISGQIVPGTVTLGGIAQGTPNNVLFGYEISTPSGAGINENGANNLQVFPNPSTGVFTVSNNQTGNTCYTVTDLSGKVLKTGAVQGQNVSIDLTTFSQGVYVLELTNNGERIGTQKLIKN